MDDSMITNFIAELASNGIPIAKLALALGGNAEGGNSRLLQITILDPSAQRGIDGLIEILSSEQGRIVFLCESESQEMEDPTDAWETATDYVYLLMKKDPRIRGLLADHPERLVLAFVDENGPVLSPDGPGIISNLCQVFDRALRRKND